LTHRPELSIVVLCYQAGEAIHQVIRPLMKLLDESGVAYELVLVANYWSRDTDATPAIIGQYETDDDRVRVVAEVKEGGMGWDMRTGFAAASGDHVVVIDGDAQNPVGDVVRVHELLRDGDFDLVKGKRKIREDGLYRRVLSASYNSLFRLMFGTWNLWDINGKPKGLTRKALDSMSLRSDDWFIDAEIVLEARRLGLRIGEMPVVFRENKERSSFVRMGAIVEFLRNMLRRRFGGTR
jgi:glycosyltransferase involved in cell wall biosynthesis